VGVSKATWGPANHESNCSPDDRRLGKRGDALRHVVGQDCATQIFPPRPTLVSCSRYRGSGSAFGYTHAYCSCGWPGRHQSGFRVYLESTCKPRYYGLGPEGHSAWTCRAASPHCERSVLRQEERDGRGKSTCGFSNKPDTNVDLSLNFLSADRALRY